jgi:hypothetical protein
MPIMGWNSWNAYGTSVSAEAIEKAADTTLQAKKMEAESVLSIIKNEDALDLLKKDPLASIDGTKIRYFNRIFNFVVNPTDRPG